MRAVVTGARGFVGPHLTEHLEANGDEVTGLDAAGPERFDVTDADGVRDHLADASPEVVYHLAALSHVGESWSNPAAQFRVNAEGTLNVVAAAAALGIRRVVVIGSSEEYGEVHADALPVDESAPLRPVTPYGAAKAAAETVALQMGRATDLEIVCVRPFPHTGPGQTDRFLVPALAARIARAEREGTDTVAIGSRTPMRDLSDVRDVVRAYRLLALHGHPGLAYNVCSGVSTAVGDIAELLAAAATRAITFETDPALVRPVEPPPLIGSAERLRAHTGWVPERTLADTLSDVLAAARIAA
ncbi:MAG: NAD-dependent epimerase/dehydratase family protein [Actinomycetes bacterium]